MTTSSRMVYAFARDGGLPTSRFFAKVHGGLRVPLNALWLTTILVLIFGCIFLGSSSAFNAIVSASVVALGVTYAIPPAINCLRGRRMLPASRPFVLPTWLGWTCNLVSSLIPETRINTDTLRSESHMSFSQPCCSCSRRRNR
jgi:amino acid transporter